MTSVPDDERRHPSEPTFADVMNGFSFDSARPSRRRRWGRKRDDEAEQAPAAAPAPAPVTPRASGGTAAHPVAPGPLTGPIDMRVPEVEQFGTGSTASAVRPYAWTRGRTKSGFDLAIETLVSTSQRGRDQMGLLQVEHRAVAELCEATRSVAEVAALLSLPLGVARVLLGTWRASASSPCTRPRAVPATRRTSP
jgi:hypothetical protein